MRLTDFHLTKHGRIAVYLDGEFALSIPPDVFASSGLSVGCELSEEVYRALCAEAELKKAKEKALSLLSCREYSSQQLAKKLQRTTDEETAAQAVERMEELGLIDDDDYAQRLARELYERKRYGMLRIRQELRQKGLTLEQIELAVELLPQDPMENIRAVIGKKYPMAYEDEAVRRRAFAALLRLGYRNSDVRRALMTGGEFD